MVRRYAASLLAGASALGLAACSGDNAADGGTEDSTTVVATTTILGDVVGDITDCGGGETVTVMGIGDDPHAFAPSSAQVAAMSRADLVVGIGLGLEESLASALEGARSDGAPVLEVAEQLDPLEFAAGRHAQEGHADEHDHGSLDPHVWLDAARMARAAELIGAELARVTGEEAYAGCGTEVRDALLQVDAQVEETLAVLPPERRILITDHDALAYFADRYGFTVAGVVVGGGSTDAEPSSAELGALVKVIRDTGVAAVFSNTAVSDNLVKAVAAEAGGEVAVVPLYIDSLGPQGSGAETYPDMMLTNARLVAEALG